jgi:hypothetical protein
MVVLILGAAMTTISTRIDDSRRSKQYPYSITSSARASSVGGTGGRAERRSPAFNMDDVLDVI